MNKKIIPAKCDINKLNNNKNMMLYTKNLESINLKNLYENSNLFLILSGPSIKKLDLSLLNKRGILTMGVNNSWAIYKPNLWTIIDPITKMHFDGWNDPSILKFIPLQSYNERLRNKKNNKFETTRFRTNDMPGVFYYIRSITGFNPNTFLNENFVNIGSSKIEPDVYGIYNQRCVMLAAFKIAYYLGIRKIFLLGADFKMEEGQNNYSFPQHRSTLSINGNNKLYKTMNTRFNGIEKLFNISHNLKIYNCNPDSNLKSFEFIDFNKAISLVTKTFSENMDTYGWYENKNK